MSFKKAYLFTLISVASLVIGFILGFSANDYYRFQESEFPIALQAYHIIRDHGLKELPGPPDIEYGMIRGLIQAYNDPFTVFVEPVQHELDSDTLQGSYGGIGVRLVRDLEGYILLYPFPDGPAVSAGLQEGDRLINIDGARISEETSFDAVRALLRGPIEKRVRITIARSPDFSPLEYSLKRAEISLPSVTWHLDPEESIIGVIEVNVIAASTQEEIENAIEDLQERGAELFILDLRDNFGGLLTAGVDIAGLFLDEGIIMKQQYRDKDVEIHEVKKSGALADIPMAVLVNEHTASAAEIIAGALKAHGRSMILGTPTYGKNSIQLVFELDDQSSIRVTAANWWIPEVVERAGGQGIIPDQEISPQSDESGLDLVVQAARALLIKEYSE
jgi:carboxyl-terminal processing protease